MADKKCPRCGLWNTGSAMRCDCGYDFVSSTVKESYSAQPSLSFGELKERGKKKMMFGALWFMGGLCVTGATYLATSGEGTFVIAYGAVIFGIGQFIIGVLEYNKSRLK